MHSIFPEILYNENIELGLKSGEHGKVKDESLDIHLSATCELWLFVCPGQLKSNSPRLMDEAVLALRNLAHQCSDSSAMEALTRHLFAILGGEQAFLAVEMAEGWPPAFQDLTSTWCSEAARGKAM